jgi:hypothetical protein
LMMLMTDPPPCYEEALVGTSNWRKIKKKKRLQQ